MSKKVKKIVLEEHFSTPAMSEYAKDVVSTIDAAIGPAVKRIDAANPSTAMKARKSAAELDHVREVMRRDGAALVCAFRRLEQRLAVGMTLTELDVDTLLHEERSIQPDYVGKSFDTIAGYQANGALPETGGRMPCGPSCTLRK